MILRVGAKELTIGRAVSSAAYLACDLFTQMLDLIPFDALVLRSNRTTDLYDVLSTSTQMLRRRGVHPFFLPPRTDTLDKRQTVRW